MNYHIEAASDLKPIIFIIHLVTWFWPWNYANGFILQYLIVVIFLRIKNNFSIR